VIETMLSKDWKKANIEQFEEWEDKKNRFFFEKRLKTILPYIPDGSRVLDIGCGDAEFLGKIKEVKHAGFSVGMDLRRMTKRSQIPLLRSDAENMPIKDESFDCIISAAVLEHLPNPEKGVSELSRILKSSGVLIITTPNPFYHKFADLGALLKLKYKEGPESPLSLKYLKKILQKTDFSVEDSYGFLASPIRVPFEKYLENGLKRLKIRGCTLLFNQIIVAIKS
jgi:ubiquinone/menaquinone biosynthesis C-methylase UbiE